MNTDLNEKPYIPITELLSFLVVARAECINSVILDEIHAKMDLLKQHPKWSEIASKFEEKYKDIAVKILSDLDILSIYPYCDSKEIALSSPIAQKQIWEEKNTMEKQRKYLSIAQAYRKITQK